MNLNNTKKKVIILQICHKVAKYLIKVSNSIQKHRLICQFWKKENMQQSNNFKLKNKNIENISEKHNFKELK